MLYNFNHLPRIGEVGLDNFFIVLILLNFLLLGAGRMRPVIWSAAIQGVIIGTLPLVISIHLDAELVVSSLSAMLLKGAIIPLLLFQAIREARIRSEIEPILGFTASLLMGLLGTGFSMVFARSLPLIDDLRQSLLVPTAFTMVFTGFVLLITRRKAISQVVGFLVLENGIFLFGLTLVHAIPFLIELGALLDLFVGVFIMSIIVNHIQRTFSSLDTTKMTALRD